MFVAVPEPSKKPSSGDALIIFFAIFCLSLSLLIVSIRLLQQPITGMHPTVLLVLSTVGMVGSLLGLAAKARELIEQPGPSENVPPAPTAPEPTESQEQNLVRVRLGKYVQTLEEQLQNLREENAQLRSDASRLREELGEWQQRSLEMLRFLDRLQHQNPDSGDSDHQKQAALALKRHLAQLVAPLGIGLIEPETGDLFDPKLHEAINAPEPGAVGLTIKECLEWGYTIGGQVACRAKVTVTENE